MKTLTSVSLSGGQGKSTLVYFLSRLLALQGFKTLVLDLDPQHNISTFLRVIVNPDEASIFEFLKGETTIESIYPVPNLDNLFIIPADDGLEVANDFLAASGMGIIRLRNQLNKLSQTHLDFDFCLVDTPPQKSQLCMTGIGSSDYFVIPAEPEVKGVLSLNRTLSAVNEIVASGVVHTQLLAILPFRDKWFGLNRSIESAAAIEQMSKLVDSSFILPSFRESTIPKKAISTNSTLADLGKPDLAFPFEQLVTKLETLKDERHLSTVR
ncbi:ParA family protein [Pleurocapsa sp. PCC 7319]|uniref:ParA family protein n=1 Tax=Pleurocapsa sp. PCC 7319 TaxID=118161 RepID=UPI00034935AC|nr:ParA family protein [Pleurocapsa sp. PCC 7319]